MKCRSNFMENSIVLKRVKSIFTIILIGLDKQNFSAYNCKYFLIHQFLHMFWVIETVLLSTHNICFGLKLRKIYFETHS